MQSLITTDPNFDAAFAAVLEATRQPMIQAAETVGEILAEVRRDGDSALRRLTARFDRHTPTVLRLSAEQIQDSASSVPAALRDALDLAAQRIEAFHRAQKPQDLTIRDEDGVGMGLRWIPLDSVGLYVPGGKAAYPSTVLMNAIPARVAGVARIAMCVPCPEGVVSPLVLAAAVRAGVGEIYQIGGAQAVAALAFGTETIERVDRIVGPGNAYVAEAKRQVSGMVGIDSIAGPSEVVIVADSDNDPTHVAMDLLAQSEHDEAAQAILLTPDASFAAAVAQAVLAVLPHLPRAAIAGASWEKYGVIVTVRDLNEAAHLVNRLAPEHVELMVADPASLFARLRHAGAVFLGRWTPEALGDYIAGPNHVLPTGKTARFASGLSVYDFLKRNSWVEASHMALQRLAPAAIALAEAEGLHAHARSLGLRLEKR
jgi:histidinol dehydrogenase